MPETGKTLQYHSIALRQMAGPLIQRYFEAAISSPHSLDLPGAGLAETPGNHDRDDTPAALVLTDDEKSIRSPAQG